MSSNAAKETSTLGRQLSATNFCHICCHDSDLFCLGPCDHPICFECGVRMRVICDSKECPICRSDVKTMLVVSSADLLSPYAKYEQGRNLVIDADFTKKYGLKFENKEALNAVRDILAHVCTVCEDEPEFRNFDELSQHMRRQHQLFYCDLCATNLELFSWERKCYTREELAKHRRIGDPDDRSHRGHPLCEFCDERFMDDEQLYRHLRRDHFFCHYCDADGMNKFYAVAEELKKHLKAEHYLCEVGQCTNEPFGVSFRHEIDFKAHKANVHGAKQERLVNLNFDIHRGGGQLHGDRERTFRDRQNRDHHEPSSGNRVGRNCDRVHGARDYENREYGNRERNQQQEGGARRNGAQGRGGVSSKITTGTRSDHQNRRDRPTTRKVDGDESDDPDLARTIEASKASMNPFALRTEEFPTLNPASSMPSGQISIGQRSMAAYVANAAGIAAKAGSLDELDFPSLPPSARSLKQTKRKAEKEQQRVRRNSRSLSPVKNHPSAQNQPSNFVMVDDDESFPSVSEQFRAAEEAARAKAKAEEEERKRKAKENEQIKQLRSVPTWVSGGGKGAAKTKAATAWDTKDEAFPALNPTNDGGAKQKMNKENLIKKPWSQLLNTDAREEKPKKEKAAEKKKKAKSPSSMATDALLEALPPGLPVKSKARRVAQQKQRPSESEEGLGEMSIGNERPPQSIPVGSFAVPPPPGFESAGTNSVSPPPGFEPMPASSSCAQNGSISVGTNSSTTASTNAQQRQSQYQYNKPQNFDLRNRALFDRLCAVMNNDEQRIQEFKKASSEYRRCDSDATMYCDRIRRLLQDDGAYLRIFGELVCLLPDIQRQNALWDTFRHSAATIRGEGPSQNDAVKRCSKCGQLLMKIDYYEHAQTAHSYASGKSKSRMPELEEEYPALC